MPRCQNPPELAQLDHGKYPASPTNGQQLEAEWRFRTCSELRETLLSVAEWAGASTKAVNRFRLCGSFASVWKSNSTGNLKVRANHCHNRWCPRCRVYVQNRTRRRIKKWLTTAERSSLKFVTLTLKPSSRPLSDHLAHLLESFKRLRKRHFWRALGASGIGVAETTRGADGRHWHLHLHLIIESPYCDARKLSAEWRLASKGSYIVKVKPVRRDQPQEKLIEYLAGYMAKEPPVAATDAKLVTEWVRALTAMHWVVAFGKRKKQELTEEPIEDEKDPGPWEYVAPLATLLLAARGGHEVALALLAQLEHARETDSTADPPENRHEESGRSTGRSTSDA